MKWLYKINRQQVAWWCIAMAMVGFLFSKALMSISMIVLVSNAVIHQNIKHHIQIFFKTPWAWLFTVFFACYILSGLNSTNTIEWLNRVKVKLPFLFLPFAFASLVPFTHKKFLQLIFFFWSLILLGSLYTLTKYLSDFDYINSQYAFAKVLPTPIDHIRFSTLMVLSCLVGAYLVNKKFYIRWQKERYVILFFTIFQFIMLHVLAVRSGLLALYIIIIYSIIYFLFFKKNIKYALIISLIILLLPLLAYFTIPTFKNKMAYMKFDLAQYFNNSTSNGYSDANRIISWELALKGIASAPITGVGIGDEHDVMRSLYAQYYPQVLPANRILPHNQFLCIWLGVGIMGLLVFILAILYLLIIKQNYKRWLFASVWITLVSALFFEPTLEIQLGTAVFIYFLMLLINQYKYSVFDGR